MASEFETSAKVQTFSEKCEIDASSRNPLLFEGKHTETVN